MIECERHGRIAADQSEWGSSRVVSSSQRATEEKSRTSSLFTSTTRAPAGNGPACSRVLATLFSRFSSGVSRFDAFPDCGVVRAAMRRAAHRIAIRIHLVTMKNALGLEAILKPRQAAVIEFCNRILRVVERLLGRLRMPSACHHQDNLRR
jgi:hypothetical protein